MVEFSDEVWCLDIMLILPGVLFVTIALPCHQELQTIRSHATIQHPFNLKVFLTLTKNRRTGGGGGTGCLPGMGSFGAGVNLITGKTGCKRLKDFGRQRQ
jgi:hypothetical protein